MIEVELSERLRTGDRVVAVVQPHRQRVVAPGLDVLAEVEHEGEVAAQVTADALAVEPDIGHVHRALEPQQHLAAGRCDPPGGGGGTSRPPATGASATSRPVTSASTARVRQGDRLPTGVVQVGPLGSRGVVARGIASRHRAGETRRPARSLQRAGHGGAPTAAAAPAAVIPCRNALRFMCSVRRQSNHHIRLAAGWGSRHT